MNDFWTGVISGLVTSCICWIVKEVFDYFRYYKGSKYSGTWVNEILDESNQVIKKDIATIKHNKKRTVLPVV